ncbi:MAG: PstS family phosphate ABC transporter substrate-binding protein [Bacillota bacterium]
MKRFLATTAMLTALAITLTACGGQKAATETPASGNNSQPATPKLSGSIKIDGSSTVGPISIAVAEEFMKIHKDVKVSVGISGSSGGFKKWVKGEIDINDSSRKIKDSEVQEAKKNGFEAVEMPVAYDGLSVVVSKENTWLKCITRDELKKIWDKGSTVKKWSEVNPSWPDEEIKLYGAGTDSGTFEYFTEYVNGKAMQSRADYTASEDDNVLVQGVSGNKNSLGYFGYAYYIENKDKIRAVAVDGGKGCVEPNDETIANLTYPIARLIYIYPSTKAMERPEVKEFLTFYNQHGAELSKQVGYTPLPAKMYQENLAKIK